MQDLGKVLPGIKASDVAAVRFFCSSISAREAYNAGGSRALHFTSADPKIIKQAIDGKQVFPETVGVVELLVNEGFTLDRRNAPGNIHFEEYW